METAHQISERKWLNQRRSKEDQEDHRTRREYDPRGYEGSRHRGHHQKNT